MQNTAQEKRFVVRDVIRSIGLGRFIDRRFVVGRAIPLQFILCGAGCGTDQPRNSIHAGAWSLAFCCPRASRSTPVGLSKTPKLIDHKSFCETSTCCALRSRWQSRIKSAGYCTPQCALIKHANGRLHTTPDRSVRCGAVNRRRFDGMGNDLRS
jgi:hypothetical protein